MVLHKKLITVIQNKHLINFFVYLRKPRNHGLYFMSKNNFRFTKEPGYIKVLVRCSNFEIIFGASTEPKLILQSITKFLHTGGPYEEFNTAQPFKER